VKVNEDLLNRRISEYGLVDWVGWLTLKKG
jgi:hypothetical protein